MYIFLPKSTVGSPETRFFSKKGLSGALKADFFYKSTVSRDESPFFRKKALSAEATELFSDFPGYKRKR